MKVIFHYPATSKKQAAISRQAARLYAEYIEEFLKDLPCPSSQKLAIIDEIIKVAEAKVNIKEQAKSPFPNSAGLN